MSVSTAHRVLGGSPLAVLIRLLLVSLLVGASMSWLGIDLAALVDWTQQSLAYLWATGFRSVHQIGAYILTGAAIVVPVWLLLRLTSIGSREPPAPRVGRWDLPGGPGEEAGSPPVRTGRRD